MLSVIFANWADDFRTTCSRSTIPRYRYLAACNCKCQKIPVLINWVIMFIDRVMNLCCASVIGKYTPRQGDIYSQISRTMSLMPCLGCNCNRINKHSLDSFGSYSKAMKCSVNRHQRMKLFYCTSD